MGDPGKLFIFSRLADRLAEYQSEHEQTYAAPAGDEEERLHNAMRVLEADALRLIATGVGVEALEAKLESFMPGSSPHEKVSTLFAYNLVQDRLQFAVAEAVVDRLAGLEERVVDATIALVFLLRSNPSQTAVKYFERAAHLFLAGYGPEVIIMCGAVLEAATAERVPDEDLRRENVKPKHQHTGTYSLGQRMALVKGRHFLTEGQLSVFWDVINWRNDAVHVQPDIGPKPSEALLFTAALLGALLPRVS